MGSPEVTGSTDGWPTIRTLDMNPIGQRAAATANDYGKLCVLYNCNVCMGKPFARTANFCPYPLVLKESGNCTDIPQASAESEIGFSGRCCQTRQELADSLTDPYKWQYLFDCKFCQPHEACEGSDLVNNTDFFHSKCCGR